jgi:hypothetical protein
MTSEAMAAASKPRPTRKTNKQGKRLRCESRPAEMVTEAQVHLRRFS